MLTDQALLIILIAFVVGVAFVIGVVQFHNARSERATRNAKHCRGHASGAESPHSDRTLPAGAIRGPAHHH